MNQPKLSLRTLLALSIVVISAVVANAQVDERSTAPRPNFEIYLHLIVGSTDGSAKSELPASLADVSRRIRSAAPYTSYRLLNTYIGRVGDTGNFEYKSLADLAGSATDGEPVTFLDWSIGNLRAVGSEYQANSFRFGARVPVKTLMRSGDGGKMDTVVNYEGIGISLARLGVSDNVPTLLGTLTLPRTSGTLFLVMTVKKTDR